MGRNTRDTPRSLLLAGLVLASTAVTAPPSQAARGDLVPSAGRTAVVSPAGGSVRVKPKGSSAFKLLRRARQIPIGSIIDTTRGRVRLATTAGARGKGKQSGVFSKGAFRITQKRARPRFTNLTLVGGRRRICGPAQAGTPSARTSQRVVRRLRGNARGRFRTRGKHSAATVRGTTWVTEDRCGGTFIGTEKGKVITNTGGQDFDLEPGQSLVGYCIFGDSCVMVLSAPGDRIFGYGLTTTRPGTEYVLCVRKPSGNEDCGTFPLPPPGPTGGRIHAVVCQQFEGVGDYTARWFIGGEPVLFPLSFQATFPPLFPNPTCITDGAPASTRISGR